MTKIVHGRVHGRTIELVENPGLRDGQAVRVAVTVLPPSQAWGEGLRRCAGALTDDAEWDTIMEEVRAARKLERRAVPEDE